MNLCVWQRQILGDPPGSHGPISEGRAPGLLWLVNHSENLKEAKMQILF